MFGLGFPEIVILLIVFGVLAFALGGYPVARGLIRGSVLGGLLGVGLCVVFSIVAYFMFTVAYYFIEQQHQQPATVVQEATALAISADVAVQSRTEALGRTPSVIAPKPLPDWITTAGGREYFQVVVGSQFASRQDAFADALDKAANVVSEEFRQSHPVGQWRPDGSDVYTHAVREKYTEEIIRTAGNNDFTVYRTYLLVDLSPNVLSGLESIWRTETKALHRSQVLILVAILTGIAALLAGFFRLDDRTKGRYRWPLIGVTVMGVLCIAVVPVLATRHIEQRQQRRSTPEIEPREAPQPSIYVIPPLESQPESPHRLIGDGACS